MNNFETFFWQTGEYNWAMNQAVKNNSVDDAKRYKGHLLSLIYSTKIFNINKNISSALIKTNNKIKYSPLPFPKIIIDFNEEIEKGLILNGLILWDANQISENYSEKDDIIIKDDIVITGWCRINSDNINFLKRKKQIKFSILEGDKNQISLHLVRYLNKRIDADFDLSEKKFDKVRLFVVNFLNFINNPEVNIINHTTTEKRNQKRIKKGKIPLPQRVVIKVDGKLKVDLERFARESEHYGYTHRFWVRGHFMHFRSDRYKNMQGKKTWVMPYIKGKGILIDKKYQVVKTND